jgi:hypothetical protein
VGIIVALFIYLKDKWAALSGIETPLIGSFAQGTADGIISLGVFAVLAFLLWRTTRIQQS